MPLTMQEDLLEAVSIKYVRNNMSEDEKKVAFARLEQLRKKGSIIDDKAELASYREEKYARTVKLCVLKMN